MKKYLFLLGILLLKEILTVKDEKTGCYDSESYVFFEDLIEEEKDLEKIFSQLKINPDNAETEENIIYPSNNLLKQNLSFETISVKDFQKTKKQKGKDFLFCIIFKEYRSKGQKCKIYFKYKPEIQNYTENKKSIQDCKPFQEISLNHEFISLLIGNLRFKDTSKIIAQNLNLQISNSEKTTILKTKKMKNYQECYIFVYKKQKMVLFSFIKNLVNVQGSQKIII